jgi:hypothetical protein
MYPFDCHDELIRIHFDWFGCWKLPMVGEQFVSSLALVVYVLRRHERANARDHDRVVPVHAPVCNG